MIFNKRYYELDIMRAAAITLVLLLHLNESVFKLDKFSYLTRFINWGHTGVDLFFALSGFLIGGQIIEQSLSGSFSFKEFYIRRFWRIIPPYYLAVLAYIIISIILFGTLVLQDGEIIKDTLRHIVYVQNYFKPKIYGGIYWTLAVEEQFYIFIPFVLFFTLKYLKKALPIVLISVILGVVALRFALYNPSADWWHAYYMPTHTRIDALLFGVLAALVIIKYKEKLARANLIWKFLFLLIPAVCLTTTFLYGERSSAYFNVCWQFTLNGIGFSTLVLFVTALSLGRHMPFKRTVAMIAKYSYTMYLYHVIILIFFINIIANRIRINNTSFLNFFLVFIAYYCVVLLISAVIYWIIDKRCLDYRGRIISRLKTAADQDGNRDGMAR